MKTMTLAALALAGVGFAVPASAMPVTQGSGKYLPQSQVVQVDMWMALMTTGVVIIAAMTMISGFGLALASHWP